MTRRKLPPLPASFVEAVTRFKEREEINSWARAAVVLMADGLRINGIRVDTPPNNRGKSKDQQGD